MNLNEPIREYKLNIIAEETELQGKAIFKEVTRFHGKIKGEIHALPGSLLILTDTSMVEGKVSGDQVIVDGYVDGEISATGKITISPQGRVTGKIQAPRIEIQTGAWVEGSFISNPQPLAT